MLHKDREEFLKVLERTSAQTGFPLRLLEKDYYITLVLSDINKLSNELIFKGGTCLSKIYFSYYRLSEDLDFTLRLPARKITRTIRKNSIRPIKESLSAFLKKYDMTINDLDKAGHNESSQYIFYLDYDSEVLQRKESIKLEIGLRYNPILETEKHKVNHKFLHPFTKELLFETEDVNSLSLKELVAEKLRATATRKDIASRDFYDLGFLLKEKFNFNDQEVISLFKRKLEEDGFINDLSNYKFNLGRTDKEIEEMKSRIPDELFPVLTFNEQKIFNIQKTLDSLNKIFIRL